MAVRQLVSHYSLRDLNPLSPAGNVPSEWGYEVSHHHISNRHFQGPAGSLNGLTAPPPVPYLPPSTLLMKVSNRHLAAHNFWREVRPCRSGSLAGLKNTIPVMREFWFYKNINRLPLSQPLQLLISSGRFLVVSGDWGAARALTSAKVQRERERMFKPSYNHLHPLSHG